ncbi:MAG: methionyl-tRNA formyltransferase, partial [Gemmatimonadetes bacterium]|nr:methionyl-tRNA formyltransferase [Gemmatimonadota bacterium]
MRILFWGTPLFAVPSLRALEEEGHDVVGVVTQPDRPAGRGRELTSSPVKQVAVEAGAEKVLTPERPRGEAFVEQIRALEADVSVVVAYGHILERAVLDVPRLGSINVHASLLPRLRGAAPVNWAIVRGHETTGVTVMRMVEAMDAGPILLQTEEPIGPDETATELAIRLAEVGAQTLVQSLALMDLGALEEREQDGSEATFAPKIDRSTARIAWNADATDVANLVRGMD